MVYLNGATIPTYFAENKISNQKYNIITFLPKVLYGQFSQFYNFFFLLICISQFFSVLVVGFAFTYVVPLVFVLTITMVKEAYDDIKRYMRDTEINNEKYEKLISDNTLRTITSAEIKVGDIIQVREGQRVPADLALLYTTGKNGMIFIKTDQLDGETDWKLRRSIEKTQLAFENNELTKLRCFINAEPPHKDIYKFHGTFYSEDEMLGPPIGLDLTNTLWADTIVTSGFALGLVIYTGLDTKARQNARSPRSKVSRVDQEISWMSFILFIVLLCLALVLVLSNGIKGQWYLLFMRYVLLLSSIIPISLRVNLDLAKTWYSLGINNDKAIPDTVARNMMIPEDLGRIEMLLSDKTGTLTQNDMEFKAFFVDNSKYVKKEVYVELKENMINITNKDSSPFSDFGKENSNDIDNSVKNLRRNRLEQTKDLILAMAICHNVTPVEQKDGGRTYQAASPDEVALVKFAEEIGFKLIYRDQMLIKIESPCKQIDDYEILMNFPFTSESKRMGIFVKHLKTNKIIYFLKGAEQAIGITVNEDNGQKMKEAAEDLSLEGLRTLSFTEKLFTEQQYLQWKQQYDTACAAEENREEIKARTRVDMEKDMVYLGVTGVEDKLQDNVAKTLEGLKQAGIKIWMLTGDKIETASCIGISSGLKSRNEKYYYIRDIPEDKYIIENELKVFFLLFLIFYNRKLKDKKVQF